MRIGGDTRRFAIASISRSPSSIEATGIDLNRVGRLDPPNAVMTTRPYKSRSIQAV